MIRSNIVDQLITSVKEKQIPLLIGLRRIGKTTAIRDAATLLKMNSFYISFDDFELKLMSDIEIYNYIIDIINQGYNLLLIDEIQIRDTWDEMFKSLYDKYVDTNKVSIIATGSSSIILEAREIGVNRIKRINASTWSFEEYCQLTNKEKNIENFEDFLGKGFPQYMNTNDIDFLKMLNEIVVPIFENDLTRAYPGIDAVSLLKTLKYLSTLANGEIVESTISRELGLHLVTVKKYIHILEKAQIIKVIQKMNQQGKVSLKSQFKIYINPHIHIWFLKSNFENIDSKFVGQITEAYWLFSVASQTTYFKDWYYIKDSKSGKEIDFAKYDNVSKQFDELVEIKYRNNVNFSDVAHILSITSKNRMIISKGNTDLKGIKTKQLIDF